MARDILGIFGYVYLIIGVVEQFIILVFYSAAIFANIGDTIVMFDLVGDFLIKVFTPDIPQIIISLLITAYLGSRGN